MPLGNGAIALAAKHKYPDCVCFEFELLPDSDRSYVLKAGFSFGLQRHKVRIPREECRNHPKLLEAVTQFFSFSASDPNDDDERWLLEFGISGGNLEFDLCGMNSRLAARKACMGELKTTLLVKRHRHVGSASKDVETEQSEIDGFASVTNMGGSAKEHLAASREFRADRQDDSEIDEAFAVIHTGGDSGAPTWFFNSENGNVLFGGITGEDLAGLQIIDGDHSLRAFFKVFQEHFKIRRKQSLGKRPIPDHRIAVLGARLSQFLYEECGGCLLELEWSNGRQ